MSLETGIRRGIGVGMGMKKGRGRTRVGGGITGGIRWVRGCCGLGCPWGGLCRSGCLDVEALGPEIKK